MVKLLGGRKGYISPLVLTLLGLSVSSVLAQDEGQAKQRLEFMRAAVESLEPESAASTPKAALTFASKPLLRYSDPTRGGIDAASENITVLLDASVWRLGMEGRPTALVTVEIYQAPDESRVLAFEFLSLSEAKFALQHKTENIRWDPTDSAVIMKEMPSASKPADSATARLVQMRKLAQRFSVNERLKNEAIECRLLTQPIDRYKSAKEKIADGAIFTFANGTNPEIGLVFESDGERWRYGILRLTAAEVSVTLDGRQIAAYDRFNAHSRTDWPYHGASHRIRQEK
ncbi:MAG TPA: hypothetical protein VH592_16765 [Gemmataceae bacterium]